MVLQMKVEAVNFRKSQEISLLWFDCFITKFENERRGRANRSPLGRIGLRAAVVQSRQNHQFMCFFSFFRMTVTLPFSAFCSESLRFIAFFLF